MKSNIICVIFGALCVFLGNFIGDRFVESGGLSNKLDPHECILLQTHKQSLIADNLGKLIAAYQLGLVSKEKAIKIFQVLEQADLAPIEGC